MIEEVEYRRLEETFDFEGAADQFSKCRKLKTKYTRDLLLELIEAEVCCKLPRDFDRLILSQLSGAPVEHKRMSGNSSRLGVMPSSKWNMFFPAERWDNLPVTPGKENQPPGNCSSERTDAVCQQLPKKSGDDAGDLGQKVPKSALCQLKKSDNPYRPPHCNRKSLKPLDTFSELGVESSKNSSSLAVESDQRGSADSTSGSDQRGSADNATGSDQRGSADSTTGNDETGNNVGSEMTDANKELAVGIILDNLPTFEDLWAEILENFPQQEADINPDSKVEITLPDENSLVSVDDSIKPETLDFNTSDITDDAASSEDEIIWPDEDSLITVYDMMTTNSLLPILNRDFLEAGKVTSDCKAQSSLNSPGLVTHGRQQTQPSHSQTCVGTIGRDKPSVHPGKDHMNFLQNPYTIPYIPILNFLPCSNFPYQSSPGNTLTNTMTNGSFVQYSLLQQPNIFPQQQNRLPFDKSLPNPINQVGRTDFNAMQYSRFGQPNAVVLEPAFAGGFGHNEAFSFWHAQNWGTPLL